jgi:hypothetical protein
VGGFSLHELVVHSPSVITHNILSVALLSLISVPIDALADANLSSTRTFTEEQVSGSSGIRPDRLWTVDYLDLRWNDTGSVITAPARWDQNDWLVAGFLVAEIGAAASLDDTFKNQVQAHRTAGENRFLSEYQNLGDTWSFGVIGAFEVRAEFDRDTMAKNAAMDALTASTIGPGLIGTSVKYAFGRVRPNTAAGTFEFKPFSGNQSLPSGHAFQAFAVATAIAENYPRWWARTLCYGGAGLVGYARIEQNAHYSSDVVAGALLGWSVARAVVHRHRAPRSPNKLSWTPYPNGNGYGFL